MNKEDLKVLRAFYDSCLNFWKREGAYNPKEKAIEDVKRITTNPFIARNSPLLDVATKEQFIKNLEAAPKSLRQILIEAEEKTSGKNASEALNRLKAATDEEIEMAYNLLMKEWKTQ